MSQIFVSAKVRNLFVQPAGEVSILKTIGRREPSQPGLN